MAAHTRGSLEPLQDLFGYLQGAPERASQIESAINVADDWDAMVPVSDGEARIIEAFFADLLDELFGPIP